MYVADTIYHEIFMAGNFHGFRGFSCYRESFMTNFCYAYFPKKMI